jgi:hypothetical protein
MGSDAVGVGRMHVRPDPEFDHDDPAVPCMQGKHEHRERQQREIPRALSALERGLCCPHRLTGHQPLRGVYFTGYDGGAVYGGQRYRETE